MNSRKRKRVDKEVSRDEIIASLKLDETILFNIDYHGVKLCLMKESARAVDISPVFLFERLSLYEPKCAPVSTNVEYEKYFFA